MAARIDFAKLTAELTRLADLERFRKEAHKLQNEIKNFDIQSHLTPAAKARLKIFEQQYKDLQKKLHRSQRNLDRELDKAMRKFNVQREQAEATLDLVLTLARDKAKKVEGIAKKLRADWSGKKSTGKKTSRKKSTRPRRRAKA